MNFIGYSTVLKPIQLPTTKSTRLFSSFTALPASIANLINLEALNVFNNQLEVSDYDYQYHFLP